MARLTLTNGDVAASILAEAGQDGRILPWRDILHEGPLSAAPLTDHSMLRSAYLAARFGLDPVELAADFAARDAVIRGHRHFDRIEIWLEHDLYDQLQLLQILAFLADEGRVEGVLLVQADDFLGNETPATILRLAERARPVDHRLLADAAAIWRDLAAPTPEPVAGRLASGAGLAAFPHMARALVRFLEELPDPHAGLGRTERKLLELLADGPRRPGKLFADVLAAEPAAFMGDWSFFRLIDDLAGAPEPLVSGLPTAFPSSDGALAEIYLHSEVALTSIGRAVLAGAIDHVRVNGIDRWWAGTRLHGRAAWRWDAGAARLVPPVR